MSKPIAMRLILLLSALIIHVSAIACSCDHDRPFMDVAPGAKLVALVKVVKVPAPGRSNGMIVEIIEIYRGAESSRQITVYGDNGLLCRPYITTFRKGKHYVMGLFGADERFEEKSTDYSISICGEYWLKANRLTKRAKGNVANKTTRIPLADIRKRLQ